MGNEFSNELLTFSHFKFCDRATGAKTRKQPAQSKTHGWPIALPIKFLDKVIGIFS
jgi:hypothetical protein